MANAPTEIKQALQTAAANYKANGLGGLPEDVISVLFWQCVDNWTTYYMNGGLYLDTSTGRCSPNRIISLIQPKVTACGDIVKISAGEVAQHIAKFLREYNGAEQAGRADLFKTPTAAQSIMEAEKARQAHGQLFKFGIDGLDDFGGVHGGQMLSIFGNPGSCKTALLTNGIRHWLANGGGKVLLFEMDMGRDMMFERLISTRLQVPFWRLQELQGTAEYKNAIQDIAALCDGNEIDNNDAHFEIMDKYDATGKEWTLEMIVEAIERKAPAVVCVDYLTLLKSETAKNKPISDYEIANTAIDTLYNIAKTYGIIVVTLSQMSMESIRIQAQGGSGGTAKGGGKVEERSDAVIELFKDTGTDEKTGEITSALIATIRKARNNDGAVKRSYNLIHSYGHFRSVAEQVQRSDKKKMKKLFETVNTDWATPDYCAAYAKQKMMA